jgi:hypothetical protein
MTAPADLQWRHSSKSASTCTGCSTGCRYEKAWLMSVNIGLAYTGTSMIPCFQPHAGTVC